ncbi:glycosyltransferase family 4 protein [Paenibacillus sp. SI8]|uniref:glycosyltransferase family 4 protein n=1 Tax=unclassified Paenibacillus TaxID=185978 RepID=UPI003465F8AD
MINIEFKKHYDALHFTNEIGKYLVGGLGSFMNELYMHHTEEIGFVHLYNDDFIHDIEISRYPGTKDVLSAKYSEAYRLGELSFDIAVCHFYEFQFMIDENFLRGRPLIYVIHSIPTPEPYDIHQPFASYQDLKIQFQNLCNRADRIVCVSHAEKLKLQALYPEYDHKTMVIHNGMQFENNSLTETRSTRNERIKLGYIGRLDYRKGILECLMAIKELHAELWIASGNDDPTYLASLISYIDGANMKERVHFLGWCSGERKRGFIQSLDALVVPSLYEPFGYVVLEAMNEQIPLICSTGGGIGEIVGNYRYSYDPYESGALRNTILQFQMDDAEVIETETMNLFKRTCLFTSEQMCENYSTLFNSLLRKFV